MVVSAKVSMLCAPEGGMGSALSAASLNSGKIGFGKPILGGLDCLPIRFSVAKIFESRRVLGFITQKSDSTTYYETEESNIFRPFKSVVPSIKLSVKLSRQRIFHDIKCYFRTFVLSYIAFQIGSSIDQVVGQT